MIIVDDDDDDNDDDDNDNGMMIRTMWITVRMNHLVWTQ